MYADRRKAFENRIGELFNDHRRAYPGDRMSNNRWRDLGSRVLSALEDSFQMGRRGTNVFPPAEDMRDPGFAGPDDPESENHG